MNRLKIFEIRIGIQEIFQFVGIFDQIIRFFENLDLHIKYFLEINGH